LSLTDLTAAVAEAKSRSSRIEASRPGYVPSPLPEAKPLGARNRSVGDRLFPWFTGAFAALILLLAAGLALELALASRPALKAFGGSFLLGHDWNPVLDEFGAMPFIYGTVVSSLLAFLLAAPFGIGIAIFLTEMAPWYLREPVAFLVEILAAIPSVVYGLWGIFVLAPLMRLHVDPLLMQWIGKPLFAPPSVGLSLFSAGVILAIMILPTIMSISREVFKSVPRGAREAVLAVGATQWESIVTAVVLPSKTGILGAIMLGLGRALGETMAVTMIIGNRPEVSANLLAPSHSIAAVIANEFAEAVSDIHLSALAELGLVLMAITLIINLAARILVWSTSRQAPPS
jgi:phosphate transport system permease protein